MQSPNQSEPGLRSRAAALVLVALLPVIAGCGSHGSRQSAGSIPSRLLREARPIGRGPSFHPPARGPVAGPCAPDIGPRYGVHIELFAADRVVLVPAGIGTRAPRRFFSGRISAARCYGDLVTLEPTGVVLVRRGSRHTLADVFRAWGQPLSRRRLGPFSGGSENAVSVFVDGRRSATAPGRVPLSRHAEIVLEIGPDVPPHRAYTFPPGA